MKISSLLRSYSGILILLVIGPVVTYSVFSATGVNISSLILNSIAILSVLGLFALNIHYSFSYYLGLSSLILFPTFVLITWFSQKTDPIFLTVTVLIFVFMIPFSLLLHLKTCKKNLNTSSNYQLWVYFIFIFLWSSVLILSIPNRTPQFSLEFTFFFGIFTFIFVASQIANMTFRIKELNSKWKVSNYKKQWDYYLEIIAKKSTNLDEKTKEKLEMIRFYFNHSIEDFIAGDLERSFENSFRILFDQYSDGTYVFEKIYKIEDYSNKRGGFSKIRNGLIHPRNEEDRKNIKKNLFTKTVELLKILKFEFMDKIK